MKKLLWLIVCLMTMIVSLTSCGSVYLAKANYEICYPDGTKNYDKSVAVVSTSEPSVICYSYGGSNYVSATTNDLVNGKEIKSQKVIASSTAPIRLNSYSVEKVKNRTSTNTNYKDPKTDSMY